MVMQYEDRRTEKRRIVSRFLLDVGSERLRMLRGTCFVLQPFEPSFSKPTSFVHHSRWEQQ